MKDAYVVMGFAAGCLWAMAVALKFNLRTARLVQAVQRAAMMTNQTWQFWSDRRLLLAFVFRPNALLDPSDTHEIRQEKTKLIEHRTALGGTLLRGCVGLLLGPIVGLVAMIVLNIKR
jgi:hypothetical protein